MTASATARRVLIRSLLITLAFFPLFLPAGCAAMTKASKANIAANAKPAGKADRFSPADIERENRAFADRFIMRISTACDAITEGNTDATQCRKARELRSSAASNIYDIVTDPDPYMQTLNLVVVVTLQSVALADEDRAHQTFGDRGVPLADAVREAHEDIQEVAAKIYTPSEIAMLDDLIRQWRQKHPDLRRLSLARFTDFLNSAEWSAATHEEATGLFSQIAQTRAAFDEARATGERTLYLSKRMALVVAWQAEATLDSFTAEPSVAGLLSDIHSLTTTADHLPATLDAQRKAIVQDIDSQRQALLTSFDQRQPAIDNSMKNLNTTLAQADTLTRDAQTLIVEMQKTSASLQELVKKSDVLINRFAPPPSAPSPTGNTTPIVAADDPSAGSEYSPPDSAPATSRPHPFEIADYTAALKQAVDAANGFNTALASTDKLIASPAWQARIQEFNTSADGRVRLAYDESHTLLNQLFTRIYFALAALAVVLILSRIISAWIIQKMKFSK